MNQTRTTVSQHSLAAKGIDSTSQSESEFKVFSMSYILFFLALRLPYRTGLLSLKLVEVAGGRINEHTHHRSLP